MAQAAREEPSLQVNRLMGMRVKGFAGHLFLLTGHTTVKPEGRPSLRNILLLSKSFQIRTLRSTASISVLPQNAMLNSSSRWMISSAFVTPASPMAPKPNKNDRPM